MLEPNVVVKNKTYTVYHTFSPHTLPFSRKLNKSYCYVISSHNPGNI